MIGRSKTSTSRASTVISLPRMATYICTLTKKSLSDLDKGTYCFSRLDHEEWSYLVTLLIFHHDQATSIILMSGKGL